MSVVPAHPSAAELAAFTLGCLDDDALAAIAAHLADCEPCQDCAARAPADNLTALLRCAHRRRNELEQDTAPPTGAVATVGLDGAGTGEITEAVPPELARHERYRVVRLLGAGGMGAVYVAEHRAMQRTVALKVINRAATSSAAAIERFRCEVRAAARLSHPNIVTTHDAEDAGATHFLVMEYVEGVTLNRLVKERGPLPIAEACDTIRQAALGLQHAHERGMVHRDIKPDNLIRCADGRVKILDFGLAMLTAEGDNVTAPSTVVGTPDYMAPEQADNPRTTDIRADVYSLGGTLYFLLTGQPPYPGATPLSKIQAHREQPPPDVRRARPDTPLALAAVLERLLGKKPEDRYPSPAEVVRALAPFTQPPRRSRPGLLVAAVLVVGLLALGIVHRIQTDKGELVITTESDDVELVVKQRDKLIRIIDVKTAKEITLQLRSGTYELELKGAAEGLKLNIAAVTLLRGEKVLARIERATRAETDVPLIRPLHRIRWAEGSRFCCVDVAADGSAFLAGRNDVFFNRQNTGKVRVWNAAGEVLFDCPGYVGRFTPDGKQVVASASEPSDFHVYELSTRKLLRRFGSPCTCWNFHLAANGTRLHNITPGSHEVHDWEAGKLLCRVPWSGGRHGACLTPDGRHLFSQPEGRALRALDASTGKEVAGFRHLRDIPRLEAISADGQRLLCESGQHWKMLDSATAREIAAFPSGLGWALSGDGRLLLTGTNQRDAYAVWDVDTRRLRARLVFPEPYDGFCEVRTSRAGRLAVFAGPGDSVYVFRLPQF